MDPYKELLGLIDEQENWRKNCINMIASENVTSKAVQRAVASDFGHRYAEGILGGEVNGVHIFERFYQGTRVFDKVEHIAMKLSKDIFHAEHANVVPISGAVSNLVTYKALAKYGDKITGLSIPAGGHISHTKVSAAGFLNLQEVAYPFDNEEMNIDVDAAKKMVLEEKPKIMIFGGSLFLFPHPIREFREIADQINASIMYDAAHVLGLIAGGCFQDPMKEGADAMTASTHKTFPGPQGGVILCKNKHKKRIDNAAFPGLMSNHHLHHVAGFAIALAEMKEYGSSYAGQTIRNAKTLASSLHELGFNVLCESKGFTESHQVVADVSKIGGGTKIAEAFEKANIIINKNLLPWDNLQNTADPSGIRIGTQEMTKMGMKTGEMKEIASCMKKIAIDGVNPEKVKNEIIELRAGFQKVQYCFDQ
ncbi:MAG: serine hydroxymethyltransferase [Candidatus Altiarchaeia archaeon]